MANVHSTPVSVTGNVHSRSPSNSLLLVIGFEQFTSNFAVFPDSTMKELKERVSLKWANKLSPSLFDICFEWEGKSKHIDSDFDLQALVCFASAKQVQFMRASILLKHLSTCSSLIIDGCSSSVSSSSIVASAEVMAPYVSQPKVSVLSDVGQTFEGGAPDFRISLLKHCFLNGYDLEMVKNEPGRITAECVHKLRSGCKWRVHASKKLNLGKAFVIKTFHPSHSCGAGVKHVHHPVMSSKLVKHVISDLVKDRPGIKPKEIMAYFLSKFGVELSYYYAMKGRELSLVDIHGDDPLSYHQLVWYIKQLEASNPGSFCVLEKNEATLKFQRVFISYAASIHGFNFCRPLVFLDATFLTGKSKGVLLAANGKNGNQGIFQLAIAIVSAENIENWVWFMKNLKNCVGDRSLTFISDRHQGLITSVSQVFPGCHHSYCYWHLERNLLAKIPKKFEKRDELIKKFKAIAHAYTHTEYEAALNEFKEIGTGKANKFVDSLSVVKWTNAHFPSVRYGETSSALAESYNSWILNERNLPITALIDIIRMRVMTMFNNRRQASVLWTTTLCPRWEEELDSRIEYGKTWTILKASEYLFEILAGRHQRVDLQARTCSCNAWQVEGFPCVHAIRCINADDKNVYDFCDHFFHSSVYCESYARGIEPVPTGDMPMVVGDKAEMLPPDIATQPGRPRTKRIGSYRRSKHKGDTMGPKAYGRHRGKKASVVSASNICDVGISSSDAPLLDLSSSSSSVFNISSVEMPSNHCTAAEMVVNTDSVDVDMSGNVSNGSEVSAPGFVYASVSCFN